MKRIICLILVFALAFSLCACGPKEKKDDNNSIDIEYYAKLGQIPECEFTLGSKVQTVKDTLSAKAEENEEMLFDVTEGEETVLITNGMQNYYYEKDNEQEGISYIVTYEKAFGFDIGEVSVTIKEALKNFDFEEEELSDDNAFFIFGAQNGSVIECEFKDNTVMFVFEDNLLCATAIFNEDF